MALLGFEEWAVRRLDWLAERVRGAPSGPKHLETGAAGEREAFFYLRRLGYTVVARRWTSAKVRGDLDLVAWKGATLCFIEVKTRTARDLVPAETAVDRGKRSQLRLMAAAYLGGFPEEERVRLPTRFDVVSVYLLGATPEFDLLENAFGSSEAHAHEASGLPRQRGSWR